MSATPSKKMPAAEPVTALNVCSAWFVQLQRSCPFGGLSNNLRLTLRELGLKRRSKEKAPDLGDILARHQGAKP
jgi:hypothetical protein